MGTRMFTEAHSLRIKRPTISKNFRRSFLYDGVNTTGSGDQANLPGTTLWFDSTGLLRLGLNLGITFVNEGAASFTLFGSLMPGEYAELVKTDASIVSRVDSNWISLTDTAVARGDKVETGLGVYTLMKIVFASNSAGGAVGCASL